MQNNLFDKSTDTGGFFSGPTTKEAEKEHYNFLNEMSHRFNVDKEKIINLEARISCKYLIILLLNRCILIKIVNVDNRFNLNLMVHYLILNSIITLHYLLNSVF